MRVRGALARLLRAPRGQLADELARVEAPGAGQLPARLVPERSVRSVCGFCSTGCALEVHLRGGRPVNLVPSRGYPVNQGTACPKGWEALAPLGAAGRATRPLLRRFGRLVPVDWDTAARAFVDGMRAVGTRHGAEAAAFLGTGQLPSEELALLGCFAKLGMRMLHGDGNTRQCMATSVVAYKECFGFDAPPYSYADLEQSDVILLVGSNLCIAHPILWRRILNNPCSPRIVVVDPRATETASAATEALRIRPKSDLLLLYAVAHVLCQNGWIDRSFVKEHVAGFEAFAAHVAAFAPERVAPEVGVPADAIERLARIVHEGRRVSFWWTMGVNQSHEGVRVAQAIIALALLTGNVGRPGTGPGSVTGQCNAMGSRLFANTTNLLGGHDFRDPEHRAKIGRVLGVDPGLIPDRPSLAYDQILDGVRAKEIRALWIVGTNPAHSFIDQSDARAALGQLDFLVVQDMYADTETARMADLVLPAAGWGEKEGTFINSERRIGVVRKVARAPGEARSDFEIVRLLAEHWGAGTTFRRWRTPEAVFRLLCEATRGQPCDITGIDGYPMLERLGGVQWPLPEGTSVPAGSERRLFEDGRFFHADGKARLCFGEPTRVPEPVDARYPMTLITGRGSVADWHTRTRTRGSAVLRALSTAEPYVEIHPDDAARLGIEPARRVVVESRRGSLEARAFPTRAVARGELFIPMHYPETNRLTFPAFDPRSRQPAYKACAVAVRRVHE